MIGQDVLSWVVNYESFCRSFNVLFFHHLLSRSSMLEIALRVKPTVLTGRQNFTFIMTFIFRLLFPSSGKKIWQKGWCMRNGLVLFIPISSIGTSRCVFARFLCNGLNAKLHGGKASSFGVFAAKSYEALRRRHCIVIEF